VIEGTIYGVDGVLASFAEVDFISFVNADTHGKPAIIAPGTPNFQSADDGNVTVLYVNPGQISALKATKY
jgi:hypothetical protein